MAIALDPNRTVDYVLKAERESPASSQTVWELGPISVAQDRAIKNVIAETGFDANHVKVGTLAGLYLRGGLRGVRNFNSANGKPIPFTTDKDGVTDAFLEHLSEDDRMELFRACRDFSTMSAEEKKA